ncbi:hypothetical protein HDU83_009686 [Entophlyctis luteolus]|nr:hypothetical protein HDU83_009686 [Entophlyctis luteolus]
MTSPVSVSASPRPNPLSIASLLLDPPAAAGDGNDSLCASPAPAATFRPLPPITLPHLLPHESFFGFIKEPIDAMILVEACVRGLVLPIDKIPDGRHWSPSRAHGPFLLYREVETTLDAPEPRKARPTHILDNRIPGLEPTYSCKTLKQNTRLIDSGLTKRTITLMGSDGQKYRVICYYAREDIIHMYTGDYDHEGRVRFTTPTESTMFNTVTTDPELNLTGLLAKSIDLEFASEEAIAKKLRKEESLKKAIARTAGTVNFGQSFKSPPKRVKLDWGDTAPANAGYELLPIHQARQMYQTPPTLPSIASFSRHSFAPSYGQTAFAEQYISPLSSYQK